ncbi:U-actitoxin-Avd3h-like [Drosophila hydei]|uniref:U-actitoxin-Avd3h-like n=1 Tax=Drosophila hydei TaxID=7224 RepID=A0A6J2SRK1_DROHY|nr:U-actitoxin-Avd3h-like [Drosophila hydei]
MKLAAVFCIFLGLFGLSLGSKDAVCEKKPGVVGPCSLFIPRWTYYRNNNTCEYFTYGGCRGNANSFHSRYRCEERCKERLED